MPPAARLWHRTCHGEWPPASVQHQSSITSASPFGVRGRFANAAGAKPRHAPSTGSALVATGHGRRFLIALAAVLTSQPRIGNGKSVTRPPASFAVVRSQFLG